MLASACSLTVTEHDPCEDNDDCRAAFGWGSTCNDEGFCAAPEPVERCTRTFPEDVFSDPQRYRDAFVIGALFDAQTHLDSVRATQLAVLEANEAGGLDGRDFAVVFCDYGDGFGDDLDSEQASAEGAVWLADVLGTPAIVGPRGSARTKAAFLALEERDVLLISPSATSPELTSIDEPSPSDESPGRLWRTVPPDDLQAEVIVADLADRDVASLAIIAQEGSYGDALAGLVQQGFSDVVGGEVEVYSYSNSPFGAVADAANGEADEVAVISSDISDYIQIFDAAAASGDVFAAYQSMGIFLTDGAFNVQLLGSVDPDARVLFDNVRGTRPAPASGNLFNTFAIAFNTAYELDPQSSGFTVHTYDATWLTIYAHARAHLQELELGGRELARGLRRMSEGNPVEIRQSGWEDVVDAFGAGETLDVAGGSGELDYDPNTEETSAPVEIWGIEEVEAGEYEFTTLGTVG